MLMLLNRAARAGGGERSRSFGSSWRISIIVSPGAAAAPPSPIGSYRIEQRVLKLYNTILQFSLNSTMAPNTSTTTMNTKMDDAKSGIVPEKVPTLTELKKILPKHCFQADAIRSLSYAAKDLILIGILYGITIYLSREVLAPDSLFRFILWPTYWFLQGTMFWALFVVAHDCGHESFSNSALLNVTVGNILNTFICVPFYAWKITHKMHHKNTGNIDRDEIFYPTKSKNPEETSLLPYWGLGFSWFIYLVQGYGSEAHRKPNHLNPYDKAFKGHAMDVAISIGCLGFWICIVLPAYTSIFGYTGLIAHYIIPLFVFGSWLVVVTFLQHQEVDMPWYSDSEWDFVRGSLSSIDRDYGWAHNLTHNIGTHQIHHLFIKIPHYHLEEATEVFRKHYPHLVHKSNEGILPAFNRMFHIFQKQQVIPYDTQIHVFKES